MPATVDSCSSDHAGAAPAVADEPACHRAISSISHASPALLHERTPATTTAQELSSAQSHLTTVCKKPRTIVLISNANENPQRESTPYGGYCTSAAAARNLRDRCNSRKGKPQQLSLQPASELADSAVEHVASASASLNTSAAAATRVAFCYAFALRSAGVQQRARHEHLLCAAEGIVMRESHAPSVNSAECTTSRDQQFEGSTAARTRTRTVG